MPATGHPAHANAPATQCVGSAVVLLMTNKMRLGEQGKNVGCEHPGRNRDGAVAGSALAEVRGSDGADEFAA